VELLAQRHHDAVDPGTGATHPHLGVDGEGEVDGGGALGEVLHVALGREDEDLLEGEPLLDGAVELHGVPHRLVEVHELFDELLEVTDLRLVRGGDDPAILVLPVGGDATLGHLVHLEGADLHLHALAAGADDRSVEGAVAVGLGEADVVSEAPGHGAPELVHEAEDLPALLHRLDQDPEGDDVIDLLEGDSLALHFAVDGELELLPSLDRGTGKGGFPDLLLEDVLDQLEELAPLLLVGLEPPLQLQVGLGVEVLEGEVLELRLEGVEAEAVGQRGVDFHGLAGLADRLLLAGVAQGAHVVEPVRELDQDDPDVLGHGQQHLAEVLGLALLPGGEAHLRQVGHALDDVGHLLPEELHELLVAGVGIFHGIVEQGRGHGLLVELEVADDAGHVEGMDDVLLPRLAALSLVFSSGVNVGVLDEVGVGGGMVRDQRSNDVL
jgi:hypothetical protein